jgi:ubiquinone/menaquinone biosynthesis C-methylase UbiE
MLRRFLCAVVSIVSVHTGGFAQAPKSTEPPTETAQRMSVEPGINEPFLDPNLDVAQWIDRFEVESREIFHARASIVKALDLKQGMRIADIGAGTGPFIEAFSNSVGPDGRVFATDIAPAFLDRISRLADSQRLSNVTPVLSGQNDIRLPSKSIDVAFICDVYHHFEYPQASLDSIHRSLKKGGTLILIDFERIEGVSSSWTMDHVRAGKSVFRSEIELAGFRFVQELKIDGFHDNYFLIFEKQESQ